MSGACDVIYLYDGSYEGLLSCVYESVYGREEPEDIVPEGEAEPSLFAMRRIETDAEHARRVHDSFYRKLGAPAAELVRDTFFSCAPSREIKILRFLLFAYRTGPRAARMRAHERVAPLYEAQRGLLNETHLLLGFLRFSDFDGVLVARIRPKNFVLPYLQAHFCARFAGETFLIHDQTHDAALVWQGGRAKIVSLEGLTMPDIPEEEREYRALWRTFSDTVAIALRENPRCRMTHCPKRYWGGMWEMPGDKWTDDPPPSGKDFTKC